MPDQAGRVVFYQLSRKFVQTGEEAAEESQQIVYYTLAIGHHIGVVDCLSPVLEVPLAGYAEWLERIPESEGRRKLDGVLRWGEIEVNRTHVASLTAALEGALPLMDAQQSAWAASLLMRLRQIAAEPALYLIARSR
jgi:hypothetical protein